MRFEGQRAFAHLQAQVEMGPRPAGSQAAGRLRDYLRAQFCAGWEWQEQAFLAPTPVGRIPMVNLLARRAGVDEAGWLVLAAHYDTKRFDFDFLGANDGASGVACLLELKRVLEQRSWRHDLVLAFLDGEEAVLEWSRDDSLYGSTWLAESWQEAGVSRQVRAVLVLDMVGDRQLCISRDLNSDPALRALIEEEASRLGYAATFAGPLEAVEDDHIPFGLAGMPAAGLIGFAHRVDGLYPAYWHTPDDTLDKVCPESLEAVGRVVFGCLERLDQTVTPQLA